MRQPPAGVLPTTSQEKIMKKKPYIKKQLHELLCQSLETERGGVKVYDTAISAARAENQLDEMLKSRH